MQSYTIIIPIVIEHYLKKIITHTLQTLLTVKNAIKLLNKYITKANDQISSEIFSFKCWAHRLHSKNKRYHFKQR